MIAVAFLICMILGLGILCWLSSKDEPLKWTDLFLSWGLGVGVVSQLTFFSILPFQQLNPFLVCVLSTILVVISLVLIIKNNHLFVFKKSKLWEIILVVILLGYAVLLGFESIHLPFGHYDGWSLWNYRAATVFRGGEHWMAIFHNDIQGKHPWLVPMVVDWGWSIYGREIILVPMMNAIIMTVATVGLLISFLSEEIGGFKALLGGVFLIAISFFTWHAISQYADIFVAYYLLAACYCLKKMVTTDSLKYSLLSGIFLALLAFTKDEGIMLCGLCLMATAVFLKPRALLKKSFILPLCLASVATLICEILMRGNILSYPIVKSVFYSTNKEYLLSRVRMLEIIDYIWNNIVLSAAFGRLRLWFPFLLLGLFSRFGRFLLVIILGALAVYLSYYMVLTSGLIWRIEVTFDRLLFQLNPVMVLLLFLNFFQIIPVAQKKPLQKSNLH